MKKSVAYLLCAVFALSLFGCGKQPDDVTEKSGASSVSADDPAAADTAAERETSAEAEPETAPLADGVTVGCDLYSVRVPAEWNGHFNYMGMHDLLSLYYTASGSSEDEIFLCMMAPKQAPDADQTDLYAPGDGVKSYEIGSFFIDGAEYFLSVEVNAALGDDPDERTAAGMLEALPEIAETVASRKQDAVYRPLDCSFWENTVLYGEDSLGGRYKANFRDVDHNVAQVNIRYRDEENGIYDYAEGSVRFFGDRGLILWSREPDSDGYGYRTGYGEISAEQGGIFLSLRANQGDSWTTVSRLPMEPVDLPAREERSVITGALKERCDAFEISLPDCWKGLYETRKLENGLAVYHSASRERGTGGMLFNLTVQEPRDDASYQDGPQPFRKLIGGGQTEYLCLGLPGDMEAEMRYEEQYNAMLDGLHAALDTITPLAPGARLERFHLGFESERYAGERGDVSYALRLTYEAKTSSEGVLTVTRRNGGSLTLNVIFYDLHDGVMELAFYSGDDTDLESEHNGEGSVRFDGDTLRLTLRGPENDPWEDAYGEIALRVE